MDILSMARHSSLVEIDKKIRNSFESVREEIEDHLVAINENTDEIRGQGSAINELDAKVELLGEKVEALHLMLMQAMRSSLNENETKILEVLDKSTSFLSCRDIAFSAAVSEIFVKAHLFSMICKGVPLKEKVIDSSSFFALERKNTAKQTVMLPELSV